MAEGPWDYVVIGAGSAGCALAGRLSEQPGCRVLLLEAGGSDRSPLLHVPAGILRLDDRYKWFFPVEPDPSRGGKAAPLEGGRVLGGTSSINGMVWVRGNRRDYDGWAAEGCAGWDYASVLPYFKRAETFEGGADEYRGGSGPQYVSFLRVDHELTGTFVEAAQTAGFALNLDYNGAAQAGVAHGQVSQRRGLRVSTATAYLRPARRRPNLRVVTGVFVHRVLFEHGRAVGVEIERRGRVERIRCEREVVSCAGAIESARLLLSSGIGPPDDLREAGVEVLAELPGVGANLQDHFGFALFFEVDQRTLNRELTPWSVLRGGVDLVARGRGPATAAFAHAVLFGAVRDEDVDYKAIFAPYGLTATEHAAGGASRQQLMEVNAVTVRPTVLHPRARGRLRLRSADPHEPPLIHHEYAALAEDREVLAAVGRRVREVMAASPMASHIRREIAPGPEVVSDADWEQAVRERGYPGKHQGGTCRMGVDPLAVVDPELRVHGVGGLRVADVSIVPSLPTGNTNAPAIMIGERAADFLLGQRA